MRVHGFLEEWARRTPHTVALIDGDRTATFAELNGAANRFAHVLRRAGVTRGERVVIALDNGIPQVSAYLGAMKADAVAVPLPAGPRSDRLEAAVRDCEPRVAVLDVPTARAFVGRRPVADVPTVFTIGGGTATTQWPPTVQDLAPALAEAADADVTPDGDDGDLAAIIYTSGSTGEPRGVMLTHANFVANARSIVEYLGLTSADRAMCVLPFYYVYGLSVLHTHLAVGGSVVIDNRFGFPNVVLEAMQTHAVTGFAGVPSTFALLLHRSNLATADLSTLRYVTQAGGNMPPHTVLEWLERGPRADFFVMYGATEAAARLSYVPPAALRAKLGSIGIPISGVTLHVVREDGTFASPGEVGELVASGPNIASGYWKAPAETAERFGPLGYRTGDLGYRDQDGFLFLVGRRHDMIKVGANRVGAKEIENVLHEHPAVAEAAVVGVAHEMTGEAPIAFVALTSSLDDAERRLQAHCAARLAAYKVPVHVQIERELPKLTGTGKIDKHALRARAAALAAPQEHGR